MPGFYPYNSKSGKYKKNLPQKFKPSLTLDFHSHVLLSETVTGVSRRQCSDRPGQGEVSNFVNKAEVKINYE